MAGSKALSWTLAGTGVVAILVIVGGYFAFGKLSSLVLGDFASAAATLEDERRTAKKLRLPLTSAELFPNRPIPSEHNAGPDLASVLVEIRKRTPPDGPTRRAISELTRGTAGSYAIEQLRRDLAGLQPNLNKISELVKRPHCDFGKEYGDGIMVKFPEMADVKNVATLFAGLARIRARDGDDREAGDALIAAFRLADCAGQEPVMIGSLVQIACRTIAYDALRGILKDRAGEPDAIAMAQRVLAVTHEPVDPLRAFRGELVMGVATIRNLENMSEISEFAGTETPDRLKLPVNREMKRAWEAKYIGFWNRVFGSLPRDRSDLKAIREVMNRETAKEQKGSRLLEMLNAMLLPVYDEAALATIRERAQRAVSQAMVEVLGYRNRNRRLPTSLAELDSALIDPFDGKPIRFRQVGAGFILYSIDRDLKDDGGKVRPRGTEIRSPGDLVVSFP